MEIRFDVSEYPKLEDVDKNQPIRIKGEGRIIDNLGDVIVVEFLDLEVDSGNNADKSLKSMRKKEDKEDFEKEGDDDDF